MNTTRIINKAIDIGFSGKTFGGAVKYILKKRKEGSYRIPKPHSLEDGKTRNYYAATCYLQTEKERKSNPEIKRALKDRKFRAKFLRRLNRKANTLLNPKSLDKLLTKSFQGRQDHLCAVAVIKTKILGKPFSYTLPKSSSTYVLVSGFHADFARRFGVTGIHMKGKNATLSPDFVTYHQYFPGETKWKWGKPVGYTRAVNDNYVRSVAWINSPQTLDYIFHETRIRLTLPNNTFTWNIDTNGLKVSNGPDDFHPEVSDLLEKNAVERIILKLQNNAEQRKRTAAIRLAEIAEMEDVWVCFNDSLRAGNCRGGTSAFADKHQLNPHNHYRATEILQMSNGDNGRAKLAIRIAIQRTHRENQAGISYLSDHTIQA
jgi:hypothetical protein